MSKRVFRTISDERKRVVKVFNKPSHTSQSLALESNIHNIVNGRVISNLPSREPQFLGELPKFLDLQRALQFSANAHSDFERMPASLRARFDNDVSKMIDFASNPKNHDEAVQLGLLRDIVVMDDAPVEMTKGSVSDKPSKGSVSDKPSSVTPSNDGEK